MTKKYERSLSHSGIKSSEILQSDELSSQEKQMEESDLNEYKKKVVDYIDGKTGVTLKEFLSEYFPNIKKFAPNKPGGVSYVEEMKLWQEGKMTSAFLKKVGSLVRISTQAGDYNLFLSLKKHREAILEVIEKDPSRDVPIIIKLKNKEIQGKGTLDCDFIK